MRLNFGNCAGLCACALATFFVASSPLLGQLTVDRSNGAVSLDVPAGDAVEVNGYAIKSPSGLLDPVAWSSFEDQGLEGWGEANPRPQQLSELNPFGSTSAAGTALSLGSAYTGTTTSLSGEDLSFEYSTTDGTVVDGVVNYVGPINDFVLRVDPASGAGQFELLSSNVGPIDLVGYSIFSDGGSLLPGNLQTLGDGWEAGSPTSSALAELNLTGSKAFTTGTTAALGDIYSTSSEADLRFEFATAGGDVLAGSVLYASISGEVLLGDCNGDGVLNKDDLSCVTTIPERDAVLGSIPSLPGDLDGDGTVAFPDFLVLSTNFNQELPEYTSGNIDLTGAIAFPDFLILSTNFNKTPAGAAAAVPEPTMGLLSMIGLSCLLGVIVRKRRGTVAAAIVALLVVAATSDRTFAQVEFDTRMIVLDAANPGPNNQINDTREARDILRGFVTDVNIGEDVTSTIDFIDFAGDAGTFATNLPYPNGVSGSAQDDFTVQVTGFLEIPEGDWTIGFNTDDGGLISMPRVDFVATGNENGEDGTPGEIIFDTTRGFAWTYGHFTVPAGETLRTEFEAIMFERGGGDGMEVAHLDGHTDGAELGQFGVELGDTGLGWTLLENGPDPGDFNWDDTVDFADFLILSANFGTGVSFAQGDFNGDFSVDLHDFVALLPLLTPPAGAATAAVPEPNSLSLLGLACLSLLLTVRRRGHWRD